MKNKIDSFFYLLLLGVEKTCQIKTTTRKKLYHAIQVLQKQFGVLVSWVETFCFVAVFKKPSEVQTSNMNWRRKLGGGGWEIVVVVVGAWKGSGRRTETLSVTFFLGHLD